MASVTVFATGVPADRLGTDVENTQRTPVVRDVAPSKLQAITAGRSGELVDEGLEYGDVVREGDAAPEGLDLSTYTAAMRGSDNGPVISVGDADNSLLVQVQSQDHFANFTAEELQNVINWINNGAPEK